MKTTVHPFAGVRHNRLAETRLSGMKIADLLYCLLTCHSESWREARFLVTLLLLHLSKSSFSQIFQWTLAVSERLKKIAHGKLFSSWAESVAKVQPKFELCKFYSHFLELFLEIAPEGAFREGRSPFASAKVLLFGELTKFSAHFFERFLDR